MGSLYDVIGGIIVTFRIGRAYIYHVDSNFDENYAWVGKFGAKLQLVYRQGGARLKFKVRYIVAKGGQCYSESDIDQDLSASIGRYLFRRSVASE